jgi:hypothetical protein
MAGVQDGDSTLDEYYANCDEAIPDEDRHDADFRVVMSWLESLAIDWRHSRFRNQADLYSLWAAALGLARSAELPPPEEAAPRLEAFETEVEGGKTDRAVSYADFARQGSNKDTNRSARARTLIDVVKGVD